SWRVSRSLSESPRPDALFLHHLLQGHSDSRLDGSHLVVLLAARGGPARIEEWRGFDRWCCGMGSPRRICYRRATGEIVRESQLSDPANPNCVDTTEQHPKDD